MNIKPSRRYVELGNSNKISWNYPKIYANEELDSLEIHLMSTGAIGSLRLKFNRNDNCWIIEGLSAKEKSGWVEVSRIDNDMLLQLIGDD